MFDKNNKPAVLSSIDFGVRNFSGTLAQYGNERGQNKYSTLPIYIDSETMDGSVSSHVDKDLTDLQEQGWTLL